MKHLTLTLIAFLALPLGLFAQAQNTAKDSQKKTEFGNNVNWKTLRLGPGNNYDVPYVIATSDGTTPISGGGGASGTVAQGSTTAGQSGMLGLGAVTTAAPTYTTAQTSAFSLDTSGNLRVSLASVPSHNVTNAGTFAVQIAANSSVNVAQVNGTTTDTNSGNKSAGTQRVVLATDQPNLTTALNIKPSLRSTWTTGQVTTSVTAGTLVASNATRRRCVVKNTDASITVYVGPATVTTANGMPLKAGESLEITTTPLIQVIAASGTPVVAYSDESD